LGVGIFDELNVYSRSGRKGVRIAIVFPSTYRASITNLFTNTAYYYLSEKIPNALVDRFTTDNPDRGALTGYGLSSFDIVLASITYELELPILAKILLRNGINPLRNKRDLIKDPLIIGGGPPIMANPLPSSAILDIPFVGEGEILLEFLVKILNDFRPWRRSYLSYVSERVKELRNSYTNEKGRVLRGHVISLESIYTPTVLIRSSKTTPVYGEGYYIEVSRGCRWLCPFCIEAYVTYPPRYRSITNLIRNIRIGLNNLKTSRVVLYSLSFFDHPESNKILEELINRGIKFSLPSIRYHTLSPERIKLVGEGGQRTLTLAPETGIPEISRLIGKPLDTDFLEAIASEALNMGMKLKLYFILGFPGEGPEAGLEAGQLIKKIAKLSGHGRGLIKVSVNPLVPKAWTPTQYCAMIRKEEFKKKLRDLKKSVRDLGIEVSDYNWNQAYIQAAISLGNYGTGEGIALWSELNESITQLIRHIKNKGFVDPLKPRGDDEVSWRIVKDLHESRVKSYGSMLCGLSH